MVSLSTVDGSQATCRAWLSSADHNSTCVEWRSASAGAEAHLHARTHALARAHTHTCTRAHTHLHARTHALARAQTRSCSYTRMQTCITPCRTSPYHTKHTAISPAPSPPSLWASSRVHTICGSKIACAPTHSHACMHICTAHNHTSKATCNACVHSRMPPGAYLRTSRGVARAPQHAHHTLAWGE